MRGSEYIDLRPLTTGGGGELSQTTINIIEQNTGTQVNIKQLFTEMVVTNGKVTRVYKYADSGKTTLLFDITINWVDELPSTIVTVNVDDTITTTTTLSNWVDGIPTNITKVES